MTDPNATYKSAYQSLREELGREPTSRDKGWLEIGEAYRRAYINNPAREDGQWRATTTTPTTSTSAESATQGYPADRQTRSATVTAGSASTTASATDATGGRLGLPGSRREASDNPLTIPGVAGDGDPGLSAPSAPLVNSRPAQTLMGPLRCYRVECCNPADGLNDGRPACSRHEDRPSYERRQGYVGIVEGDRGPSGGIMAQCVQCGRMWERERRRGRPAYKCGECR